MGLTICDKHGAQATVNMCLHVYQKCQTRELHEFEYYLKKDGLGSRFYLCGACLDEYGLRDIEVLGLDELERMAESLELEYMCGKCFPGRRGESS